MPGIHIRSTPSNASEKRSNYLCGKESTVEEDSSTQHVYLEWLEKGTGKPWPRSYRDRCGRCHRSRSITEFSAQDQNPQASVLFGQHRSRATSPTTVGPGEKKRTLNGWGITATQGSCRMEAGLMSLYFWFVGGAQGYTVTLGLEPRSRATEPAGCPCLIAKIRAGGTWKD